MVKVLIIGQLPKECGGNYTTGIAKVVYELSRQKVDGMVFSVYATNTRDNRINITDSPCKYYGYKFLIGRMFINTMLHPIRTIKEWKIYKSKANVNPLRFEFYKANFQKILEVVEPDIIHMNGSGIEPLFFANNKRIPVVHTCHGVFQRFKNPDSSVRLFADYVTGLTDETRDEIINYFCVDESKITIIPNGVDTSRFYFSLEDRQNLRNEFGIDDNTKVFITVASVQERKGQFRFTKILNGIQGLDWQYWIVGKGPDEQKIKEYCDENGLGDKVKLLGYKNGEELYKYYSAADVYAHASTMEGQALCEIEAFSTGIKILVNEVIKGTIAKSELNEGDYLMLDFTNPDYDSLRRWLSLENNQRHSIKTMDWSVVAKQYGDLFKSILS